MEQMNMMPNGMPAQGPHMNRMQQPQPGNGMQQLHATIYTQMKNELPKFAGSWQATYDARDRANRVIQLLTALRLIETDMNKCLITATKFEAETIAHAQSKEHYQTLMHQKNSEIQAKRNQNANNLMMRQQQQQQQQQQQNGMRFPNGNQMNPSNPFPGQMPQQQPQQMPNMTPQNGTLNPAALNAPPMQQQLSQHGNQQMNMSGAPNINQGMQQSQQPSQQDLHNFVQRSLQSMPEEQKNQMRQHVNRQMSEQQRQQFAASKKDPLLPWLMNKAKADFARKRAGQMGGAPNMQMPNGNTQQGSGGFDFASIMGQQANAQRMQADGGEVVPASNNSNVMFNNQMNTPNPQTGGINPAMLGGGSNNGNNQMPNGMNPQMQRMMLLREQQRQEAMRNSNAVARNQALQQAQLHGQPGGLAAPNALTGAAGGSPAMTMLNRPMQNPPGSQTPNTPQQPNRAPNMQPGNNNQQQQQLGQTPGNGANALLQHHQNMLNMNNQGFNMQGGQPNRPNPVMQNLLANMPQAAREKFNSMPPQQKQAMLRALQEQQMQRQQAQQAAQGNVQGGMPGMGNGMMPNMGQQLPQSNQPAQMQDNMTTMAQLQARMQQQQAQQMPQQQPPQPAQPGQPTIDTLTWDNAPNNIKMQVASMRRCPPQIINQLGIQVPPNVLNWAQVRQFVQQNPATMPPGTLEKITFYMHKWFQTNPADFQNLVRQMMNDRNQRAAMQNKPQAQQMQGMPQQPGQPNMGGMNMPNGAGGAPTAQMVQPSPQQPQPGQGGSVMGPGQAPMRTPGIGPITPQDIALFRQKMPPHIGNIPDEKVIAMIESSRQSQQVKQNSALKQAQLQHQLQQGGAPGAQKLQQNRTPVPNAGAQPGPPPQAAGQGQKRGQPQPPSSGNDDVMEIPNPNAPQVPTPLQQQAAKMQSGQFRMPTEEELARMPPQQREQIEKRMQAIRAVNEMSKGQRTPAAPNMQLSAAAPTQQTPAVAAAGTTGVQGNPALGPPSEQEKLLIQKIHTEMQAAVQKGPPVELDVATKEQAAQVLRKVWKPLQTLGHTFHLALRAQFPIDRLRNIVKAKLMVYQNWDEHNDRMRDQLSLSLVQLMQIQHAIQGYLTDLKAWRSRIPQTQPGQAPPQQAQAQVQAPGQRTPQVPPAGTNKQPPTQAEQTAPSRPAHNRKASSANKPPAAPTENKTFDWGAPSPHGVPRYQMGGNDLTPDKLKFPPNKKRRTGPDGASAASTPAGQVVTPGAPGVSPAGKPMSPEQMRRQQQVQAKAEEEKRRWRCNKDPACEASIEGFETEEQLKNHFESAHKPVENPLEFLLSSAADALGVDADGKPKAQEKPKLPAGAGARLGPKAVAMKREKSNTPGIKQEVRTPAGQLAATPATPGSGAAAAKGAAKAAPAKPTEAQKPKSLQDAMAEKMGYHPVSTTSKEDMDTEMTGTDALFQEIATTLQDAPLDAQLNDVFQNWTKVDDWGYDFTQIRTDGGEGIPSSPETTPSSEASRASDVSANDRLRINLEWDAFGNGDTMVPDSLNAGLGGMDLEGEKADGGEWNWNGDGGMDWTGVDFTSMNEVDWVGGGEPVGGFVFE